ncbi:hypothetical protein FS837_010526 [Tulasnella sp. UAMH 9824]|nr:hypothetical protein FS837_010526 [Tulasnella sp. UAMH 9824]
MKLSAGLAAIAASLAASGVTAVAVYGQCGGIGYTGSTVCDSGSVCTYSNDFFSSRNPSPLLSLDQTSKDSQCLPGTATTTKSSTTTTTTKTTTTTTKTSTTTSASPSASTKKFKLFGVNESCAEFGTAIPGTLGTDYTWPATTSIDYFVSKGFNTFRVPFMVERLTPGSLAGSYDSAYLASLKSTVSYITGKSAYAVIDPHNYLRYNGAILTDTTAFANWWKNLANQFKDNSHVIFDLQNEPWGIDATVVASFMQAAINAIRAAGATNLVLVEGTAWSGAWSWTSSSGNAAAFAGFTDPGNNFAIEMHQYLDSDSSGSSSTCVSSTIGAERIADATAWLKSHGFKGFLGEIGGGSNDVCIAAIKSAFTAMQASDSPWIGALWWAAGPWWGTYFQSIEPPSGPAVARILPEALVPYLPVTGL